MGLIYQAYEFGQFGNTYIVRINPGQKLIASLMAEVVITKIDSSANKIFKEELGLKLINFSE